MATGETTTAKRLEEYGLKPTTAKELEAKFDAITRAEYDRQETDLQNATNQYYNQLYGTQTTAMDTIRQANAQAVATGASKGVQAANELSAILGLQSESATGAAELANQATTLAQDETAAMLENMLNAETKAQELNAALAQLGIQQESVDVESQNAQTAESQMYANSLAVIEQIRQTNPTLANDLQAWLNAATSKSSTGIVNPNFTAVNLNQSYLDFAPTFEDFTKQSAIEAFGLPPDAVSFKESIVGPHNVHFKLLKVDADKLTTAQRDTLEEAVKASEKQDKGGGGRWVVNQDGDYAYQISETTYGKKE